MLFRRKSGGAAQRAALAVLLAAPCLRAERPPTIPALRSWADTPRAFTFNPEAQIVLDDESAQDLTDTANTFLDDLRVLTGYRLEIGLESVRGVVPGDIVLAIVPEDEELGDDGYALDISRQILIRAQTPAGVFYGTRTVLQLLRQGPMIGGGAARDFPDFPERGMLLDVGRKFFPLEFLKEHVRELAYLKLNQLHLHLSDSYFGGSDRFTTPGPEYVAGAAFRLESAQHPELTSEQHYTKAMIADLVALASRYHVTIVPEIDMPGHARALAGPHPELQLLGEPDLLDVGKPEALQLARELIEEYLPLFPGPYWHLGADEYLPAANYAAHPELLKAARASYGPGASAEDAFIGFVNAIDALVQSHGKRLVAWDDVYAVQGARTQLNTDISIDVGSAARAPKEYTSRHLQFYNAQSATLYYSLGRPYFDFDPVSLYEDWAPYRRWLRSADFSKVQPALAWYPDLAADTPGLRGAKLSVWCDFPDAQTVLQVEGALTPGLRALAQNSWGSPKWAPEAASFDGVGDVVEHAPDFGFGFRLQPVASRATLARAETAAFQVIVGPILEFTGNIDFTCSTAAPGVDCEVSPASVTLDGPSSEQVTVSVTRRAGAPSAAALRGGGVGGPPTWTCSSAIAAALLFGSRTLGLRARVRRRWLCGCLVLVAVGALGVACSKNAADRQTLVVRLRGVSGTIARSVTLSVDVQ